MNVAPGYLPVNKLIYVDLDVHQGFGEIAYK